MTRIWHVLIRICSLLYISKKKTNYVHDQSLPSIQKLKYQMKGNDENERLKGISVTACPLFYAGSLPQPSMIIAYWHKHNLFHVQKVFQWNQLENVALKFIRPFRAQNTRLIQRLMVHWEISKKQKCCVVHATLLTNILWWIYEM